MKAMLAIFRKEMMDAMRDRYEQEIQRLRRIIQERLGLSPDDTPR